MSFRRSSTVVVSSTAAAGVVFEEVDSLLPFVVVVVAALPAAPATLVGAFELTKFSLSLSAYLFASWRSFSARVRELALSISNRDRLLVLKEPGVRMVAVTEVDDAGVPIEEESPAADNIADFVAVVFVRSSVSVFL